LIAVDPGSINEVKEVLKKYNLESFSNPIGVFISKSEKVIYVKA
jgi:hypothetical protein